MQCAWAFRSTASWVLSGSWMLPGWTLQVPENSLSSETFLLHLERCSSKSEHLCASWWPSFQCSLGPKRSRNGEVLCLRAKRTKLQSFVPCLAEHSCGLLLVPLQFLELLKSFANMFVSSLILLSHGLKSMSMSWWVHLTCMSLQNLFGWTLPNLLFLHWCVRVAVTEMFWKMPPARALWFILLMRESFFAPCRPVDSFFFKQHFHLWFVGDSIMTGQPTPALT